jgi:hypothetical protein
MSQTQVTPTSKKKEILHIDKHLTDVQNAIAMDALKMLNQYKEIYKVQINEKASVEEIAKSIQSNSKTHLFKIKHSKEQKQLQETFPNLSEDKALEILAEQSHEIADSLVKLSTSAIDKLKGSGLTIDNFILNDEFVMNSKVEGRIKNKASIYCQNQKQKDLRNLATKVSELVKNGLKSGLLAPNRLGVVMENIIDVNTGEIKHHYILRQ